jgi:hypothetical protein
MASPCSAKRRASDKDLPVRAFLKVKKHQLPLKDFVFFLQPNNKLSKPKLYVTPYW